MRSSAATLWGDQRRLVEGVIRQLWEWREYLGKEALDPKVLAALAAVPREEFVDPSQRALAYHDTSLPLAFGQRMSAPSMVAVMTDLIRPRRTDRVLEIGTGSGYQAAVLSRLVAAVYSVEAFRELAIDAVARLERLGHRNIAVRHGDGFAGWPEHAPFDAIIVTAAPTEVPEPLLAQLKPGGRMVIPVGPAEDLNALPPLTPPVFHKKELWLIEKDADGAIHRRLVMPVHFVPMVRPEEHNIILLGGLARAKGRRAETGGN